MSFFNHFVEDIRKAVACICCLVLLGPILFFIGVWQFTSAPAADGTRQNNINTMNGAIDLWTTKYEPIFALQKMSVVSISTGKSVILSQDHSNDLSDTGLNSYIPVKFTTTGGVLPITTWNEGSKQTITFNSLLNISGTFSVSVELFSTQKTSDSQSSCNSNNGEYLTGSCYYYYVLSGVCVKISQQGNSYALDTSYGGPGCTYSNGFPGDSGRWIPAQYTKVSYNGGEVLHHSFDFSRMPVTVRHQNDPYIFAENLTQGSLSFGLTTAQKFLLGVALMAVGGFFMIPCCIFVVVLTVCLRRKHHHRAYHAV